MGYIKKEFVIIDVHAYPNEKEVHSDIKKWIDKLGEDKKIIYFNNQKTNFYTTIFMDWDGSKEGWEESNKFDDIRKDLIKLIKNIAPRSDIYYVCNDEYCDEPYMKIK